VPTTDEDDIDTKLHKWQEQDGTRLMPDIPTQTLFAQWAEEDAQMTAEEREAEDRLWEDFEKGLAAYNRMLQLSLEPSSDDPNLYSLPGRNLCYRDTSPHLSGSNLSRTISSDIW